MNGKAVKRHVLKTITWRVVGSIDTIVLSWIITGDLTLGLTIGGAEVVTKMVLYYFHERVWYNTRVFISRSSRTRHIIKTITWRLIGTVDTMFMGWIISGDPTIGMTIGGLELITKMLLYYLHERAWHMSSFGLGNLSKNKTKLGELNADKHVYAQAYSISRNDRRQVHGHHSCFLLFTGLSGSGKSTIANQVEVLLNKNGQSTFLLDGDNIRMGLNKGLGFSEEDRAENLRRIGEVGKLFVDSGQITLAAFVSPTHADRKIIRDIIGQDYLEVFINTPLEICESRDVKGLYAKARSGEIKNFTGISAPYEKPEQPDIEIKTEGRSVEDCAEEVYQFIQSKMHLHHEQILS